MKKKIIIIAVSITIIIIASFLTTLAIPFIGQSAVKKKDSSEISPTLELESMQTVITTPDSRD